MPVNKKVVTASKWELFKFSENNPLEIVNEVSVEAL